MDYSINSFYGSEDYRQHRDKYADLIGPNGSLLFVACDAGTELAENVRREYQSILAEKYNDEKRVVEIPLLKDITNKFEGDGHDGTCPRISHNVAGADAYVFQNCMDERRGSSSLNDNLMQLIQMIYTLKSQKVSKVSAVMPYYPYSRQDKPSFMKREASLARLVADLLTDVKVNSVISYHPHSISLSGFFPAGRPFNFISGIDLFVDIFSEYKNDKETVAVSTDAGGFKEIRCLAENLGIDYCAGSKDRPEQKKTNVLGVGGDLEGKKRAIIIDDETATFSSCFDLIEYLHQVGIKEFHVGVSHLRIRPDYIKRLEEANSKYNMVKFHTTDSVPQVEEISKLAFAKVHSLAKIWAFVINRMHYDLSVSKLFDINND
ncbi:ribose-phosphate diphosphokinase [Candidatus Woesearchaeota archaeon]|nr:ribose-phosphate diphosphokinase [Candidatus Woesearchaeota archaeon]